METNTDSKIEKFDQVAKAIIHLVDLHGLEAITHARVHQASKVSRPWLYKYIGKEKKDLLAYAVNTLGRQWARLDSPWTAKDAKEFQERLIDSTLFAINFVKENPMMIGPYFRFKGTPTPIGKTIEHIEDQFLTHYTNQFAKHYGLGKAEGRIRAMTVLSTRLSLAFRVARDKEFANYDLEPIVKRLFKTIGD